MKYENDPLRREHPPEIFQVGVVHANERMYLGWLHEDFEEAETCLMLFDAVEVKISPSMRDRGMTDDAEHSDVTIISPWTDVPEKRMFQAYDELQVFDMSSALAKMYLEARRYILNRKVVLTPTLARKEMPHGTR
jgi:hypothetical protein